MSLILFFGLSAILIVVSVIYVGLVIRHHWLKPKTNPPKELN